jgi:nucleotide-binding universal stress UspA family protein
MNVFHHPPAVSPRFNNVLLATDLSPVSEMAFQFAQAIARRYQSRFHAVHVGGEYSYQLLELGSVDAAFWEAAAESGAAETLEKLFRRVPRQVPLRHGDVWEVINAVVESKQIELLVLGTHARKGLERLLYGSVAEDVVRNARCPVLTVGPEAELKSPGDFSLQSILLATDFDSRSEAPHYAARLCNDFHATLTLLHVAQELTARNGGTNDRELGINTPMPRAGDIMIRKLMEENNLWCRPDSILEYGDPATRILEVAARIRPDLIVLGARYTEPGKVNSHLARPTIAKVVAGAPCPVLTVKKMGN